ncbi:MAG: hypothetical protein KC457_30820, partial [Myxococcales bacterium]|nr:hypothetical protein [Myxococcales bacterium]
HSTCVEGTDGSLQCWGGLADASISEKAGGVLAGAEPRAVTLPWKPAWFIGDMALVEGRLYAVDLAETLTVSEGQAKLLESGVAAVAGVDGRYCITDKSRKLRCRDTGDPEWRVPTLAGVTDFAVVNEFEHGVCAVKSGKVQCVGAGSRWTTIRGVKDAAQIEMNMLLACARSKHGKVSCWEAAFFEGAFDMGEEYGDQGISDAADIALGAGGYTEPNLLVRTNAGGMRLVSIEDDYDELLLERGVLEIAAGFEHACARIDDDGDGVGDRLECFGIDGIGQLGKLGDHVMVQPIAVEFGG